VRYEIPVDDDPMLGLSDAPITIVEFSDYECPYCRRWHTDVYPSLLETYGDQIRFVYRDFPLESIHANAKPAAEAANCAYEQGAFWEYHDKLFGMQLGLSSQAYQEYASQLELDEAAFQECIESGRYQEEVQSDFEFAANLGVRSTPTFFINGIAVVGAQPFEVFQEVIERELAGEIP
jgi:protein-disulfide isomerase